LSVEKVKNKHKTAWRVRWRDEDGRPHAKSVPTKADAIRLDGEIKRRKSLGELGLDPKGRERLSDFVRRWWADYAESHLAIRTQESYLYTWDRYIDPDLGSDRLIDITPEAVVAWAASLRARKVGESTIYRALVILQGVLQRAVEWGELRVNPVRLVRKPRQGRTRIVRPIPDEEVESLIAKGGDVALVTAFLAYAGLRPAELRALEWEDISENLILVDKAAEDDGSVKQTKNFQNRTVPVRDELRPFLVPKPETVFGRKSDNSWRAWVRRQWPASFPPYDLRHTYASKLIHEGHSIVEVASWMGHDPAVLLRIYAHMFEERRNDAK